MLKVFSFFRCWVIGSVLLVVGLAGPGCVFRGEGVGYTGEPTGGADPMGTTLIVSDGEAKELAVASFQELGETLKRELEEGLARGGPVAAVDVCYEKAPVIAREMSERYRFEIGRASHQVRNPSNAPEGKLQDYLQRYRGSRADAPVKVHREEGEWLVVAPIVTGPLCLTCHGAPETFPDELRTVLAERYPDDSATGFQVGDLRGVFWARIPEETYP